MTTDQTTLVALRKSVGEYVQQLSEELLYWMEELNRLEVATAGAPPATLAARKTPLDTLAAGPDRKSQALS